MTDHHNQGVDNIVPLREWIEIDATQVALNQEKGSHCSNQVLTSKKYSLLRKSTVAYGIVELLKHARHLSNCQHFSTSTATTSLAKEFSMDNFIVHIFSHKQTIENVEQAQWNDIRGVSMLSPTLSAQIAEPLFLSKIMEDNMHMGMYLEVNITPSLPTNIARNAIDLASDSNDCHLFGVLFYELCTGVSPFSADPDRNNLLGSSSQKEPPKKKSTVRYDKKKGKSYSSLQTKPYTPLQELGFPSSLSLLVQNLIDGHDAYSSLEPASSDIHLLISDPSCFLFDLEKTPVKGSSMQLRIKKGKLYGREREVSLITDAFCRVSSGKSEAFFIGGYSGSGKTMFVESLRARVDIAGGYVLTQKVDQMSKERPLLDVISAFNKLCLLIRDKNSPSELHKLANKIRDDFESDFAVLAQLLPDLDLLFPQLAKSMPKVTNIEQAMNLQSILQRFMAIVSSSSTPVMLFLDDLQWAGSTSLDLIYALLSNKRGSSCFFFVGTYRDNEVYDGHPVFTLMSSLDACCVKSTKEHMSGLNRSDLNMMISESLCIFPRLCKPLSDIIFEKTEGSPYFALEFLRSLVDSRLMRYSLRERRWIWDGEKIRSENITDNVLYLLSAKMTSLPENVQLVLKVLSCFGIKSDESVVDYLSSTLQYSDIRAWLGQAISVGCIQKLENEYRFVHDKVREAAYSLIVDSKKRQFHYDLGILLYSVSKGQDLSGALFQVVDQINHGIPSLIQPAMELDFSKINFSAGSRAMDFSDYETAYSYLNNALLLLPTNHWSHHYDFSLRLFFLRSKAAYSCGNIEEAYASLKIILEKGSCVEDRLDAYYLHATILHARDGKDEAYAMCCEVLSQLKETMSHSVDIAERTEVVCETGALLAKMSDKDLLDLKEMDNIIIQFTLKFYNLMGLISYFSKPELMVLHSCRAILLSLKHGMCQDSVISFARYAFFICQQSKHISGIREASRVGKATMRLLKRFDSSKIMPKVYLCYYGFVAIYTDPLQLCSAKLRKGFEVGVSAGNSVDFALYYSILLIRTALLGGQNLFTLLKETDYHLKLMDEFRNKILMPYLTSYRETISTLIDRGQSSTSKDEITGNDKNTPSDDGYRRYNECIYFNKALQSFWLGHSDRCRHYSMKVLELRITGLHNKIMILFYATLNAFRGWKNANGVGYRGTKSRNKQFKELYKDATSTLRSAAELSPMNFSHKLHLLEAEMCSSQRKNKEAELSYAAAMTLSCRSDYVHEHGLACELAGFHYKMIGGTQTALECFQQSKLSYIRWGSEVKVEFITHQMENIASTSRGR